MKVNRIPLLAVGLLLGAAAGARAQDMPAGVQGELMRWYDDAANKMMQLAEAIPAEKYSWRPMEGVRSVGEVIGHVTGGNYFLMGMTGARPSTPPASVDQMTAKADLIRAMQQSVEFVRASLRGMSTADLDAPATVFGRETTKREACVLLVVHSHEHLGQLIAYARSNGVTPPWSMQGGQ